MKSDARAAANAILAANKVRMESCWAQTKHAFVCAPGSALLFIVVALTEVFTNTMIIMFNVGLRKTYVYMGTLLRVIACSSLFLRSLWLFLPNDVRILG